MWNHILLCKNRFARAHTVGFSNKMLSRSTDMPRVLCLKGFWAFCVRMDVPRTFHNASTGGAYPRPLPKRRGDESGNVFLAKKRWAVGGKRWAYFSGYSYLSDELAHPTRKIAIPVSVLVVFMQNSLENFLLEQLIFKKVVPLYEKLYDFFAN